MTSLCGHDRALLRWACAQSSPMIAVWSTDSELAESERGRAVRVIVDPDKLAAITAELLRERGVPDLSESEFADVLEVRVRAHGEQIMIARRLPNMHKVGGPLLEMPQARALTLALLDAPNATAQDIERMIEEVGR